MTLATIEDALEDVRAGRPLIVVDDENRENEGDLTLAAEFATPETINFMARYGRGLICAPLHQDYFEKLAIPLMVSGENNHSKYGTNFGVSVGAVKGVTTGISAADRAKTVQTLVNPNSTPQDLSQPGHIFPLRAQSEGVLARRGHTEAAVDLARLAGLAPAGVICEILNEDGTMARLPQLEVFAQVHHLKIISIEALVAWRRQNENFVRRVSDTRVPTAHGEYKTIVYEDPRGVEHLAMCLGEPSDGLPVRLHSACLTGDVFGSLRCDCGQQLKLAQQRILQAGNGIILYLNQEGRGIGLTNKIRAYALQDQGLDTVEANRSLGFPDDARTYDVGAAILKDLGVSAIELMTNNPKKVCGLEACGIEVVKRLPHQVAQCSDNNQYLRTKAEKLGHFLPVATAETSK